VVFPTRPYVDDRPALQHYSDGGAELVVLAKIAFESVTHSREALIPGPRDLRGVSHRAQS
jgi:hypothetical protein